MRQNTILFLGEFEGENEIHRATRRAVLDAASGQKVVLNTRWMGPDNLALYPGMVSESAGIVLAPPPTRGIKTLSKAMLAALTTIRESRLPFLATGESHGLVFIEAARSILGLEDASSSEFEEATPDPVVHKLPPAEDGFNARIHDVELDYSDDPVIGPLYAAGAHPATERTDIITGLNPDYAGKITEAGFRVAGRDRHGGRPYLHVLDGHPFHVTAAFLPQLQSAPDAPHPLFSGLVAACVG